MKLSEPLRPGDESISIAEANRAACIREVRAVKAEYLGRKTGQSRSVRA